MKVWFSLSFFKKKVSEIQLTDSFETRVKSLADGVAQDLNNFYVTALWAMLNPKFDCEGSNRLFGTMGWRIVFKYEPGFVVSVIRNQSDFYPEKILISSINSDFNAKNEFKSDDSSWIWSDSADGWILDSDISDLDGVLNLIELINSAFGQPRVVLPWVDQINSPSVSENYSTGSIDESNSYEVLMKLLKKSDSLKFKDFNLEVTNSTEYLGINSGFHRFFRLLTDLSSAGWDAGIANYGQDFSQTKPVLAIFEEGNSHFSSSAGDFNVISDPSVLEDLDKEQLSQLRMYCKRQGFEVIEWGESDLLDGEWDGIVSEGFLDYLETLNQE